jgi:hypothetical protein
LDEECIKWTVGIGIHVLNEKIMNNSEEKDKIQRQENEKPIRKFGFIPDWLLATSFKLNRYSFSYQLDTDFFSTTK